MIVIPPFPRRRPMKQPPQLAVAALTLVSASFDPDGPEVYLTFDREIDIAGLAVGEFAVADGPDGHRLVGFGTPIRIGPNEVQVVMRIAGAASGADTLLTAGAGNGIVASDDGAAWEGVEGLGLPFG